MLLGHWRRFEEAEEPLAASVTRWAMCWRSPWSLQKSTCKWRSPGKVLRGSVVTSGSPWVEGFVPFRHDGHGGRAEMPSDAWCHKSVLQTQMVLNDVFFSEEKEHEAKIHPEQEAWGVQIRSIIHWDTPPSPDPPLSRVSTKALVRTLNLREAQ